MVCNMLKSYWFLIIFSIVFMATYSVCTFIAAEYHQVQYDVAIEKVNNGISLNIPVQSGLPKETDTIFYEINHFSNSNNIFLIGSSTVQRGIIIPKSTIPETWHIHNLAIGGGSPISENILHVNFLNAYANHKPDKSDVLILHVCNKAFTEPPDDQRYVAQLIRAYGVYSIDDTLQVHGYMPDIYREWMFSKERVFAPVSDITGINKFAVGQSIYLKMEELVKGIISKTDNPSHALETVTYHSPEVISKYQEAARKESQNNTYPSKITEEYKKFLKNMSKQTNVVVIDMYLPSWQKDLDTQKEYENWVQSDFLPFLMDNQITYIDVSASFHDYEFEDSAHLNKAGREHFTKLFDDNLIPLLNNISSTPLL